MQLSFEQSASLGLGASPSVVHMPDNSIWLFGTEAGRLKAKAWQAETGNVPWELPNFGNAIIATSGKPISFFRLKNVSRVGTFGVWHQAAVIKSGIVVTKERHRVGIWNELNASKILRDAQNE